MHIIEQVLNNKLSLHTYQFTHGPSIAAVLILIEALNKSREIEVCLNDDY